MATAPDIDFARLAEAVQRARLTDKRSLDETREMVREYTGNHYAEEGTQHQVPCNLIALFCQILTRTLCPKNPAVMLDTFERPLKPVVKGMESWTNPELDRMEFDDTIRRCVLDALFVEGRCKVALATPGDAAASAWGLQAGQPYAMPISGDDWLIDPHARRPAGATFMGHTLRVPLDAVKGDKSYSKARKDLRASPDSPINEQGDEKLNVISRSYYTASATEFEDHVNLWELYLPRHRVVVTLAHDQLGAMTDGYGEPLKVQPWIGPSWGPYHFLNLGGPVPGNCRGKAPIQDLIDLHRMINDILRKLGREAHDCKTVLPVMGGAMDDAGRLQQASDGEMFRCDSTTPPQPVTYGGPNQQIFMLFTALQQLFSWLAGNLDMLGGLSPQSKTARQDEMLGQQASGGVADKLDLVMKFITRIIRSLCWYWWHHPQQVMRTEYRVPGVPSMSMSRLVTPQMRQAGPFEALDIKIDPYSMQHQSPQQRLSLLNEMVQQVMLPLAPMLQQQGVYFDMHTYLDRWARYANSPDILEMVSVQEPPPPEPGGQGGGQGGAPDQPMPGKTERSYVRENRSERTPQGQQQTLQQLLAGGKNKMSANGQPQPLGAQ